MEGDNKNDGFNDIENSGNACNHGCNICSDDGKSIAPSSDSEDSVNDHFCDIEEKRAARALALLLCINNILPIEGLPLTLLGDSYPMINNLSLDKIQDECLKVYEEEKAKAKKFMKNLDGHISLSVDILRCSAAHEYLCLTAHFIDGDWNLRKWTLNFRRINESLDDHCFDGATLKAIKDWDIGNKISSITLENCWFVDEGVDMIKDYVREKRKLQFDGQMFRLYCCADIFKLMVQDAFEEISKIIVKVDEFMSFGKPTYLWQYLYDNLKKALEFEAKGYWNKDEYAGYDKPTAEEWKKVEGICKLLESLYIAANAVFEAKSPTANVYLHNLQEIRASLTRESVSSDCFISSIAKKMLQKFEKFWKNMVLVMAIATVMDPRCKMKYIEFSSLKYGGNDGNSEVTAVLTAIRSLYDDYVIQFPERENFVSDSTSADLGEESSRKAKRGCHNSDDSLLQEYHKFIESTTEPLKSELDLYLEDSVLPWSKDFDILSWWRAASPKYPILSKMARDFLAIPVSVVTSVDAYYTIEREITRRDASLRPDLMNAFKCCHSWYSANAKSMVRYFFGGIEDFLEKVEFAEDFYSCLRLN